MGGGKGEGRGPVGQRGPCGQEGVMEQEGVRGVMVRGAAPHLGDDLGGVVVLDRVLAEEVEVEHVLGRALLHVLHA